MAPTPASNHEHHSHPTAVRHEDHSHFDDVGKFVIQPNLVICLMAIVCFVCMGLAVYQGNRGSWKQLERIQKRREEQAEARIRETSMDKSQGMGIVVSSSSSSATTTAPCPKSKATETTPLLLVVPPSPTPDIQKGFPSPAWSAITEIPPLQEGLGDLEAQEGDYSSSSSSSQRTFSY